MSSQVKRVGIIQSCYIPWRGYFDFINSVDLFVIYDDIQYSKNGWRNRNLLKTESGTKWITVPTKAHITSLIDEVKIAQVEKPWQETHRGLLKAALGKAMYFNDMIEIWETAVSYNDTMLSQLNVRLIKLICAYLNITTPIIMSRDLELTGHKTDRLIHILKKVGATTYLSGPSAKVYLDEKLFAENAIVLEYKTYDYEPYLQLWGEFNGYVTVLDLIANVGPDFKMYLTSKTPNQVAVSSRGRENESSPLVNAR